MGSAGSRSWPTPSTGPARPSVQRANRRLLRELGRPRIPPEQLARITVPTSLIWGRHDRVIPLRTAQEASARHGWPLRVVDHAGHFATADQPAAFLAALRAALAEQRRPRGRGPRGSGYGAC